MTAVHNIALNGSGNLPSPTACRNSSKL